MNNVNLIGKVSMLYPTGLPVLDNVAMIAITTDDQATHVISGRGRFKLLMEKLTLNQSVAINGRISYHSVQNNNTAIINVDDMLIL